MLRSPFFSLHRLRTCDSASASIVRSWEVGMLSRRALVGKLAATAAVGWAASVGRATQSEASTRGGESSQPSGHMSASLAEATATRSEPESVLPENGPAPWALLRPLAPGAALGHGWSVGELTEVKDGSCVLSLQNDRGREHRVHLCRNDGRPQGLVYTEHLDLVVMNGGQGDLPTDEGLAQAVAQVSHVVAANEGQQRPIVVALLPHAERLRLFATGEHARLR